MTFNENIDHHRSQTVRLWGRRNQKCEKFWTLPINDDTHNKSA